MAGTRGREREPREVLANTYYSQTLRGLDFGGSALVSVATPGLLFIVRCRFTEADLRHATLDHCHFRLCDFTRADLRSASLRGASFAGCDLTDTDLRGADLFDSQFRTVGVGPGSTPTRLDGARFDAGALRSARFGEGVAETAG